jgi:hypothetical protein
MNCRSVQTPTRKKNQTDFFIGDSYLNKKSCNGKLSEYKIFESSQVIQTGTSSAHAEISSLIMFIWDGVLLCFQADLKLLGSSDTPEC